MVRNGPWVDMPAGTTTALSNPPKRTTWTLRPDSVTVAPDGLWFAGPVGSWEPRSGNLGRAFRDAIEYREISMNALTWAQPPEPSVTAPRGATVEYELSGYDLDLSLAVVYPQDVTGLDVSDPYETIRVAPIGQELESMPTASAISQWRRVDDGRVALANQGWGYSPSGAPYSLMVSVKVPSDALAPGSPSIRMMLTAPPNSSSGGIAVGPISSSYGQWYLASARAVWAPWRYRFVFASAGMWNLRQRQSLTGNAGGWPLRQRQNGGATGSWPLRQRQTGT